MEVPSFGMEPHARLDTLLTMRAQNEAGTWEFPSVLEQGHFPSIKICWPTLNSEHYFRPERVVQAVLNLRVISPFLAMRESNQSPAFLTVPKGAVVETSYDLDYPGLARIKLQDQPLFAFIRDLRECAEPVERVERGMAFAASA